MLRPNIWQATIGLWVLVSTVPLAAQVLRFAAIPEEPLSVIQERFTPLLRYLDSRGMSAVLIATPDMQSFVEAVTSKRVDFAWMNGFSFVQARARMEGNLSCVVQRKEDIHFQSVIVTRSSEIASVDDLVGKILVFGPRQSVSGHLMPRHFLKQQWPTLLGKLKATRHAVSHEAVIDQVQRGAADAGVVSATALERSRALGQIDDSLRTIYTTPKFSDYCFVLTGDRDPALVTAVQNALTGLDPR